MESSTKNPLHKAIVLFFALAALEGLVFAALFFTIPTNVESAWLWGYSRSRVLMILFVLLGSLIFLALSFWFWRARDQATALINKLEVVLREVRSSRIVAGVLTFLFVFAMIYLIFAYTNLDYRVPSTAVTSMEQFKAYLYRLAPFFWWGLFMNGQGILILTWLGYFDKAVFHWVFQILALVIFPFLWGVFWVFKQIDPFYYITLAKEDNLIEWLTVFFLILTAVFSFLKVIFALRNKERFPWFFLLFGIACVLFALEEVSWGQRIFGLESTKFFLENSDQQEINVHNVVNEWFSIRTKHVAAFALFIYGVILPVLALNQKLSLLFAKLAFVVPSKVLIPGFALASWMTIDRFFNGQDEEVAELFFSLCLFLVVFLEFFRPNASPVPQIDPLQTA